MLNDCSFDKFNLVVGKNSTGKSKTLNVIFNLAQAIAGRRNSQHESEYEFIFENRSAVSGRPVSIIFKEEKVNYRFDQYDVSQGMFRAFSLLTYTHYMRLKNTKSTLLIDDIGEGLDYERSKNLIKKIEEICIF